MPPAADALPDLHQAVLDTATVEQLFHDIESCAQLAELIPKYAAHGYVPPDAALTAAEARSLLLTRQLRALQLRYRYDGADWWDTLQVLPDGFRLVRIRHEFPR